MTYQKLIKFGDTLTNRLPVYNNDPLTMCLPNDAPIGLNHGSNAAIYGQGSLPCQVYMAQRCANNWDAICDYAIGPKANETFGYIADNLGNGMLGLSAGDLLIRNAAMEKYRVNMAGTNCGLKTESFNPVNPSSPYISYFVGSDCKPSYYVDPMTVDKDILMHKLLDKPNVAPDILTNIYTNMYKTGMLSSLNGTRLGTFFGQSPYRNVINYTNNPKFMTLQPVNYGQGYVGNNDTSPFYYYPSDNYYSNYVPGVPYDNYVYSNDNVYRNKYPNKPMVHGPKMSGRRVRR